MPSALTLENMSPGLLKGVERAKREPEGRFHALAHLLDVPALTRAYRRARSDAAVGVDGVTKEQYGQDLEINFQALHARLKAKQYRHQPIRRVHIPKAQGKTRPIGISAFEDKLVQDAVREVLEAIYEQDFLECSYGFRPGRSAHDAVRTLKRIVDRGEVRWILEADIVSFFDSLDRTELKNYVLDLWFETEVKPRLQGKATLIRYCDDFIIGFEREDDARRVQAVLDKRMGRYGLTLHPDKTRLVPFWCPPQVQQQGQGPATFDFLGFTLYWRRTRTGHWRMGCKTRRASLRRAKKALYDWCRRHRHQPVEAQHAALGRRLRGHFNYFGVSGNFPSLLRLVEATKRAWYKWLCRRSQRKRLNWERFTDLLRQMPLPRPRITVRIWGV